MAVIEDLSLSVAVHVDGAAATEYNDPDVVPDTKYPQSRIVSKYIESKDDAEYQMNCLVLPQLTWLSEENNRGISFDAYIDGKWRRGKLFDRNSQARQSVLHLEGVGSRSSGSSEDTLRKFKFNAVTTVDVADSKVIKKDMEAAASLGVIRVEAWRTLKDGVAQAPSQTESQTKLTVAEKALKGRAVSHGTSLASPMSVPPASWVKSKDVDGQPYAIFIFKYRSRGDLRNEMIVPRTPSPEPAAEGVDALSQEELRRLAEERLAQIKKEKKPVIKREFDEMYDLTGEDAGGSPRPVKILRRRKTPETIDLSED